MAGSIEMARYADGKVVCSADHDDSLRVVTVRIQNDGETGRAYAKVWPLNTAGDRFGAGYGVYAGPGETQVVTVPTGPNNAVTITPGDKPGKFGGMSFETAYPA